MVHIAIIGGGIGGLTAAVAFKEFGFECEVFEQAPELFDVGAAIAIWPNAMRVLERLNLAEKILAEAGVMEEIRWVDRHGWLINQVSIAESNESQKHPAVALHRADLQSALLEALPESSIHLGHTLVHHSEHGDKMVASFANGHSIEADFLIGADGIHSRVRSDFLKDGDPVSRGYTVWRGISSLSPEAIPPATAIEFYGSGKRFGLGPVGLGRIGWWATANVVATDELSQLFEGWYPAVLKLIRSTPSSSILKTAAFDRPANRNWGKGRMTLLGDAIHPTTPNLGQGGCLAMEDALVLARSFQKYGAAEQALRQYELCRYKRTATVSRYSRYYGSVGQWENVFGRALRRTALALMPENAAIRLMQIVFDYDATSVQI
jgi:2-polyprenyl-6-methoxyphenol hydroxylase-like FAD-dependent oxidoreductase